MKCRVTIVTAKYASYCAHFDTRAKTEAGVVRAATKAFTKRHGACMREVTAKDIDIITANGVIRLDDHLARHNGKVNF